MNKKCQYKDCENKAIGETLKQVDPTSEVQLLADITTCNEHWMILRNTWGLANLQRLFDFTPRRLE